MQAAPVGGQSRPRFIRSASVNWPDGSPGLELLAALASRMAEPVTWRRTSCQAVNASSGTIQARSGTPGRAGAIWWVRSAGCRDPAALAAMRAASAGLSRPRAADDIARVLAGLAARLDGEDRLARARYRPRQQNLGTARHGTS